MGWAGAMRRCWCGWASVVRRWRCGERVVWWSGVVERSGIAAGEGVVGRTGEERERRAVNALVGRHASAKTQGRERAVGTKEHDAGARGVSGPGQGKGAGEAPGTRHTHWTTYWTADARGEGKCRSSCCCS